MDLQPLVNSFKETSTQTHRWPAFFGAVYLPASGGKALLGVVGAVAGDDDMLREATPAMSTGGRIGSMSKPTSIKTSEEVRDRLRILANERGTTITELLAELATREPTAAEREQRAVEAAGELGIEYTDQVQQAGQDAWAKIRAHQGDAAA
ncbi:hypothetical protein ABZX90_43630 [Streptomyces sp. NPDC002935]|uniref:hypothetical protein n=1 Tax=unclassified Streptomyces TaxID=2593676 RepID=UPI0033247387